MSEPKDWPLREPSPAPEIFVDGYQGAMLSNGVVKLCFFSNEFDAATGTNSRRVVARLTMPLNIVGLTHQSLGELMNGLANANREAQGQC